MNKISNAKRRGFFSDFSFLAGDDARATSLSTKMCSSTREVRSGNSRTAARTCSRPRVVKVSVTDTKDLLHYRDHAYNNAARNVGIILNGYIYR